jgi:hypothetical protein
LRIVDNDFENCPLRFGPENLFFILLFIGGFRVVNSSMSPDITLDFWYTIKAVLGRE